MSAEDESTTGGQGDTIRINYNDFFSLPEKPNTPSKCIGKCKYCLRPYKYKLTSKGNLLKHLQTSHPRELSQYKLDKAKLVSTQRTFMNDGSLRLARVEQAQFKNQEKISIAIVKHLCGEGGLSISFVEKECFCSFMKVVEPRFQPICRAVVTSSLNSIYEEEKKILLDDITKSITKPSATIDFWTGCDSRSFLGCTIHFLYQNMPRNHVLFFIEVPPPHTSERDRARFENELDKYGISCFMVVTDNASNMKCAFEMSTDDAEVLDDFESSDEDEAFSTSQLSPRSLKFDGWIGCASHQLQLVVNDGYKELTGYRRVQATFSKVKAVSALSRKSSHFSYALSHKIPLVNNTRWNSHYRLHVHMVSHMEDINQALIKVNRTDLVFTDTQKNILSLASNVMDYFSEATNILQR